MSTKTKLKPAARVRCTGLLGDSPPLTPDANGWWWLWWGDEWCISRVRFEESLRGEGRRYLWVTTMRSTGAISGVVINDVGAERWGGRLAAPGDSPSVRVSDSPGET